MAGVRRCLRTHQRQSRLRQDMRVHTAMRRMKRAPKTERRRMPRESKRELRPLSLPIHPEHCELSSVSLHAQQRVRNR